MSGIQEGDIVDVLCEGRLKDGTIFFQATEEQPLRLVVGEGKLFLALEEQLIGMKPGDSKTIELQPEEGFGSYNEKLILKAPKDSFNPEFKPVQGAKVSVEVYPGKKLVGTITEVDDETVTIDFNHPLAGKKLIFVVTIVAISTDQDN
ncbi:MAG: peptidylprolyl isomerase [Thermoplasmata archaeon]|nr:MAG: peptidylprolyl isomerase [Thermoplasmata archaeon]